MEEEQYILRLPEELRESMRFALSSTKRRDAAGEDRKASSFSIDFKDERNAVFTVDGVEYPASVMDLPTVVETHKTADKRTFYKSSDLHQVVVVRMPDDPAPEEHILRNGLTPAAKDASNRLKPPKRLFSHAQVESVECRVKMVIDHKVKLVPKVNAPKKDQPDDKSGAPGDDMEVVIEEEKEDTAAGTTANPIDAAKPPKMPRLDAPSPLPVPVPASAPAVPASVPLSAATPSPAPIAASPAPSADVQPSPLPSGGTPLTGMPVAATPSAATPLPEPDVPDEEEDDDDDDFAAEMGGALMEGNDEDDAQKRIEIANLDQKVTEQKQKITDLEERAAKAPNAVLRSRILAKRGDLQATLTSLEKERAALGDLP